MNPDELQKWCENHPDYSAYKEECKKLRQKLADDAGMSYDDYITYIEKEFQKGLA